MTIKWKDIRGYPTYQISDTGLVRRCFVTGKTKSLTPRLVGKGYHGITVYKNSKPTQLLIHRLVAEYFISSPNTDRYQINHIDGVKTNNNVSNLEWCNGSENQKHAFAIGLKNNNHVPSGKESKLSKIILQYNLEGVLLQEIVGIHNASRMTNVPTGNIRKCFQGKLNSAGGFVWKLKL